MFKKLLIVLLLVIMLPTTIFAEDVARSSLFSGTWFVYGFGLYQPTDRVEQGKSANVAPVNYTEHMVYGGGIGKDNVRLELSEYLNKARFVAAYDFFPKAIATPYVGFIYSQEDESFNKNASSRQLVYQPDALVGITFQPIPMAGIYAEYLLRDNFFFVGVRLKLSYTVK